MGVRYSYGDFTTRGHGVIEGYFGYDRKSKSKEGQRTKKLKNISDNLRLVTKTDDPSIFLECLSKKNNILKNQIIRDIDDGNTVRACGYIISKSGTVYKIYQSNKKSNTSKVEFNKEVSHEHRVNEAYRHLLKINLANKKK